MQTATTTQARKAIRSAAKQHNITLDSGYTDKPGCTRDETNKRYVGMLVVNPTGNDMKPDGKMEQIAKLAENMLNNEGLTANVRVSGEMFYIIRATCVIN